ncbi:MAG: lipoprotein [Neomegalonema sp.]|nr:lipoprotein [Neomegalonema sp.]
MTLRILLALTLLAALGACGKKGDLERPQPTAVQAQPETERAPEAPAPQ